MDNVHKVALIGGLFACFTFVHFFVDWVMQTHAEAMAKHNNWKVRARHCTIYMFGFFPLMWFLHFTPLQFLVGCNILFWSHFVEDTYLPVLWWAKHIRKPPQMSWRVKLVDNVGKLWNPTAKFTDHVIPSNQWRLDLAVSVPNKLSLKEAQKQLDKNGFIEFISETLGKILMIAIDQLIHLAFLFPLVLMAMSNIK